MSRLATVILALTLTSLVPSCDQGGGVFMNTVSRLDTVDLAALNGVSIHLRSTSNGLQRYAMGSPHNECSPYFVDVNRDNEVVEVLDHLVLRSCGSGYLDTTKFEKFVSTFSDLGVAVLSCDSLGNVYLNPDEQAPPVLVRVKDSTALRLRQTWRPFFGKWMIKEGTVVR